MMSKNGATSVDDRDAVDYVDCTSRSCTVTDLEKQLMNIELQQKICIRGLIQQLNEIKQIQEKLGENGRNKLQQQKQLPMPMPAAEHRLEANVTEQSTGTTDENRTNDRATEIAKLKEENRMLTERLGHLEMSENRLRREMKRTEEKHAMRVRRHREMTNATKLRHLRTLAVQSDEIKQVLAELQQEVRRYDTSPPTCNIEHLKRTKELYKELTTKLAAKNIARVMFQRDALTLSELEFIVTASSDQTTAADRLLKIVLSRHERQMFDCFLEAIKETNQNDVYLWIVYPEYNIDVKHTESIRRHYIYLIDNIDPKYTTLLAELFVAEVIDQEELDDLEAEQSSTRRSERLLSLLSRKSADQFDRFLSALDRTGQQYVADVLRGVVDPTKQQELETGNSISTVTKSDESQGYECSVSPNNSTRQDGRRLSRKQGNSRSKRSSVSARDKSRVTGLDFRFRKRKQKKQRASSFTDLGDLCPKLCGEIRVEGVNSIAYLKGKIYTISEQTDLIRVYKDTPPFKNLDDLYVDNLSGAFFAVACSDSKVLYIACHRDQNADADAATGNVDVRTATANSHSIWRITWHRPTRFSRSRPTGVRWPTRPGHVPCSMSVKSARLLITETDEFDGTFTLNLYQPNGETSRIVPLPTNMGVLCAVETDHETFLVGNFIHQTSDSIRPQQRSTSHRQHLVSEVDDAGHVMREFGYGGGPGMERLEGPRSLAVDGDGNVLVTDSVSKRVVLVDSELEGVIRIVVEELDGDPLQLCYDWCNTGRLFVLSGLLESGHIGIYECRLKAVKALLSS